MRMLNLIYLIPHSNAQQVHFTGLYMRMAKFNLAVQDHSLNSVWGKYHLSIILFSLTEVSI